MSCVVVKISEFPTNLHEIREKLLISKILISNSSTQLCPDAFAQRNLVMQLKDQPKAGNVAVSNALKPVHIVPKMKPKGVSRKAVWSDALKFLITQRYPGSELREKFTMFNQRSTYFDSLTLSYPLLPRNNGGKLKLQDSIRVGKHIVKATMFLHDRAVVHMCLISSRILFRGNVRAAFGEPGAVYYKRDDNVKLREILVSNPGISLVTFVGTIYRIGIILWEILTGPQAHFYTCFPCCRLLPCALPIMIVVPFPAVSSTEASLDWGCTSCLSSCWRQLQ